MSVASEGSFTGGAETTRERVALALMNAVREHHGLDPIEWDFPAISSWHRTNALRQADAVLAALGSQVLIEHCILGAAQTAQERQVALDSNGNPVYFYPSQYGGMGEAVAWVVDGPLPLDSSEVFLVHAKALEAFNDWGKRITPLFAAPQPPANAAYAAQEPSPLAWLAEHTNYELNFSGWDEDPAWLVHSVNGGRDDREWTLIGTGDTPEAALRKAMGRSVPSTDRGGA